MTDRCLCGCMDRPDYYGNYSLCAIAEAEMERRAEEAEQRRVTTPFDDPIVQACIDHGGHFWPDDAPEDEPPTCTRCWFNPGWKAGKPRNESNARPVTDNPQA